MSILTLNGDVFATDFNRVVHGQRGNYVEFANIFLLRYFKQNV